LTLLGLSLSIGILVDDSIVILENINRHIKMGKTPRQAAYDGRMEIGFTAISITLIDVVVFVPIILAEGMVADMLRPFSVVLVASTLMSLLVSFTLVPFLASRFSSENQKSNEAFKRINQWIEETIDRIIAMISNGLQWTYQHSGKVIFITIVLFAGSIALIPAGFIGIEFTKGGDRSEFIMELELDQNATFEESERVARQVEGILKSYKDVETVYTNIGITSSGRIVSNTQNLSEVYVKLKPKEIRGYKTSVFSRKIKKELMSKIPGLKVRPVEINLIGLRDDDAVQLTIAGNNSDSVLNVAQKIYSELESIPGAIELQSNIDAGKRIISVVPNREAMELLDIDQLQAGMSLRTAINGMEDFSFRKNDAELPIRIILNENFRNSISDIEELTVLNSSGASIPFREFAEISEAYASSNIERINRANSITIKSQVIGRPAGTVSNMLKAKIEKMNLSPEYNIIWGGATKRTMDGLMSLIFAAIVAIALIYLVLVALYNSFTYPWVVLLSFPLAIIGAFVTLALSMESLGVFTVLGLIILLCLIG